MKANAPEKIYCGNNGHGNLSYSNQPFPNAIEYACIDNFIEKACSWLKENKDKYLYNTGESGEYIPTCSTKMIEEFAKYMEGE